MVFTKRSVTFMGLSTLLGLSFLIISATNELILSPQFYQNSGELLGMPGQDMEVYIQAQKSVYFFEAIYLVVKIGFIALLFNTALYFYGKQTPFIDIFNIVMLCEFIFMIAAIAKVIWFHIYYPSGTLADWHRVYIFSALSLIQDVPADWYYPLQTLNIFEICYWFLLAYGLARVSKLSFDHSLALVMKSYIPALIIWVAGVTFCSLLFFPQHG